MSNPFTISRWLNSPWQMWQLFMIAWASIWQIVESHLPAGTGIAIANLTGATIAMVGMALKDTDSARAVERWAYVMIIWSMGCYLGLALRFEGWMGLIQQPNLGVTLSMAVVGAAASRIIGGLVAKYTKRRRVRRQARKIVDAVHAGQDPEIEIA